MVGIITGLGLGTQMSSLKQLGSSEGEFGNPEVGGLGENVYVNAANGNLVIERTDEILSAMGIQNDLTSVYNSLAPSSGYGLIDNNETENSYWQSNASTSIGDFSGTFGTTGSSVVLTNSDGSTETWTYLSGGTGNPSYQCTEYGNAGNTLSFSSSTNTWTFHDPAAKIYRYYTGAEGSTACLSKVEDDAGNWLEYSWNTNGTLASITSSDNEYISLSYGTTESGDLQITVSQNIYNGDTAYTHGVISAQSNLVYTYDNNNRLSTIEAYTSSGSYDTITYGYAANSGSTQNEITSITQTGGEDFTIAYNTSGQVTSVAETLSSGVTSTTSFSYNTTTKVTSITDESGNVTQLTYDSSGDLIEAQLPAAQSGTTAQTFNYTYNGDNDVLTEEIPEGVTTRTGYATTTNTYYSDDMLDTTTDALWNTGSPPGSLDGTPIGNEATYTYNSQEQVLTYTVETYGDAQALTTRYNYNSKQELEFMISSDGEVTSYLDTSTGEVSASTQYPNDTMAITAATLGGTATVGDVLSITLTPASGSPITFSTTVTSGETAAQMASALKTAGAGDSAATTAGFEFSVSSNVLMIYGPSGWAYSQSVSGSATETITLPSSLLNPFAQTQTPTNLTAWIDAIADNNTRDRYQYTYDWRGNLETSTDYSVADTDSDPYETTDYVFNQGGDLTSEKITDGTGVSYTSSYSYDWLNRVLTATTPNGLTTTTTYNDSADTITASQSNGLTTVNTYNLADQLISTEQSGTDADTVAGTTTYTYNDAGNIYNQLGQLGAVTDPDGNTTYYLYDKVGRQVATVEPNRAMTRTIYTQSNQVAATVAYSTVDSTGHMTTIDTPNSNGQLTNPSVTSVLPSTSATDMWNWNIYDADGNLIQTINAAGYTTVNTYDNFGNLVQTTAYATPFSSGTVSGFQTTPPSALQTPTADAGADETTLYYYNGEGQVIGTVNGQGYFTENTYNNSGQLIQTTQYATAVSSTYWDTFADLTAHVSTSSQDRTTQYFYDGRGLLLYTLNANLVPTENIYDDAGNLVETIAYGGSIAAPLTSNTLANLQAAISAADLSANTSNQITWYVYDTTTGNLDFKIDALGDVTEYSYDNLGQVVQTTKFATTRTTTTLPSLSTMTTWAASNGTGAEITSSVYNEAGQLVYSIDPVGDVTGYTYDADGNVIAEVHYATQDPVTSSPLESTMNAWATTVGEGLSTQNEASYFYYDAEGRQTLELDLVSCTLSGSTYTYKCTATATTYTSTNQVASVRKYANGYTYTSTSENAGPGTTAPTITASGTGDESSYFYYNNLGQQTLELDLVGCTFSSPDYTYTFSATATTYTFDGQVASVTNYANEYSFTTTSPTAGPGTTAPTITADPTGDEVSYLYYNDLGQQTLELDLASCVYNTGTSNYTYTYDATATSYNFAGQVASVTKYANGYGYTVSTPTGLGATAPTITADPTGDEASYFYYNNLGQQTLELDLVSCTLSGSTYTYTYDATATSYSFTGRVASVTGYENQYSYTSSSPTGPGATAPTITADPGSDSTTFYYYDALNRQIAEVNPDGVLTVWTYNALGDMANQTLYATEIPTSDTVTTSTGLSTLEGWAGGSSANNAQTFYYYNAANEKVAEVNAARALTVWTYDSFGNMASETQYATQIATTHTIATTTSVATLESWSGGTDETTYTYDLENRLIEQQGQTVTTTSPTTLATTTGVVPATYYTYDNFGNLTETVDPMTATTFDYYNALNQKIAEVSAVNALTVWTYDAFGNTSTQTQYVTEISGHTVATSTALSSLETWAGGSTNTSNRITAYTYDGDNRLLSTEVEGVTVGSWSNTTSAYTTSAGINISASNTYDNFGNLVETTDGNGYISYNYYNADNQKIGELDPDGYLTTYQLDHDGNVLTEKQYANAVSSAPPVGTNTVTALAGYVTANTAEDRIIAFTYDPDGNRLTETHANVQNWSVGSGGALTTNAAANSEIIWTYNVLSEVASVEQATGDTTTYTYDPDGRLIETQESIATEKVPVSGTTISMQYTIAYTYNGLNDLLTSTENDAQNVGTPSRVTTYTYNAAGWLATETDPTGFEQIYGENADGQQVSDQFALLQPNGTSITTAKVTQYNLLGQQTVQTVATLSGSTWTFGDAADTNYNAFGQVSTTAIKGATGSAVTQVTNVYNNAGWLTESNSGNGSPVFYLYDKDGNQTLSLASSGYALPDSQSWSTLTLAQALTDVTTDGDIAATDPTAEGFVATFTTYDARDMALKTIEPFRELTSTSDGTPIAQTTPITLSNTYDAFGDILTQTDANGNETQYAYSMLGQVLTKTEPSVTYTNIALVSVGGVLELQPETATGTPVIHYYDDISGRQIGTRDALGNLTTQSLLANTGYDGSKALVLKTFNPDTSVTTNLYDVFGELSASYDGDNDETTYVYNGDGYVMEEAFPSRPAYGAGNDTGSAIQLVDYYAYDGLGERIASSNNQLITDNPDGDPNPLYTSGGALDTSVTRATTTYDDEGRITEQVDLAGNVTTNSYVWQPGDATTGLGTFGGWKETTHNPAGLGSTQTTDSFGHVIGSENFGGIYYTYSYDLAGRLISQVSTQPATVSYTYYNTGQLQSESDAYTVDGTAYYTNRVGFPIPYHYTYTTATVGAYEYDANGNLTSETTNETYTLTGNPETGTTVQTGHYASATATYNSQNEMVTLDDTDYTDTEGAAPVTLAWTYDENGNVTNQQATYYALNNSGDFVDTDLTQDYWFAYDSMNRVTLSDGIEQSGQLLVGDNGASYLYDAAGRRIFSITTVTGQEPNGHGGTSYTFQAQQEEYTYSADGYLAGTSVRSGTVTTSPTSTYVQPANPTGSYAEQSTDYMDAMGRVTTQVEYSSGEEVYSKTATYDNDSNVTSDTVWTLATNGDSYTGDDSYYYGAYDSSDGLYDGAYQGVLMQLKTASYTNSTYEGTTYTTYGYTWTDQPNVAGISYQSGSTTYTTTEEYDQRGLLWYASIDDAYPRYIEYVQNVNGEIIYSQNSKGPTTYDYFFGGVQEGTISNNGTTNVTYTQSIAEQQTPPGGTGFFTGGATTGTPYAAFGTDSTSINGLDANSTAPSYTVQSGDTLESIAQEIWGDSSYWYLIADANGISGDSQLEAGQVLTIPTLAANTQNNASTDTPYNATSQLGSLTPNHMPPPSSHHGCGVIGEIILAVIAVVAAVFTAGAAAALLAAPGLTAGGTILGGITALATGTLPTVVALAAGAIGGAVGSIVSQGVGLATGLQSKFNWASVGEAAIGGAVGDGIASTGVFSGLNSFASGFLSGATGSVVSQGIDLAAGLQNKFNWADVAEAGVEDGVTDAVSANLPITVSGNAVASNAATTFVSGMAGALAGAATKTALGDGSFGQNFANAIPDAIGQTVDDGIVSDNDPTIIGSTAYNNAIDSEEPEGYYDENYPPPSENIEQTYYADDQYPPPSTDADASAIDADTNSGDTSNIPIPIPRPPQPGDVPNVGDTPTPLPAGGGIPALSSPLQDGRVTVSETVELEDDGSTITTYQIAIKANFTDDGGILPYTDGTLGTKSAPLDADGNPLPHMTVQQEADAITSVIESDYTKSFVDDQGNVVQYFTTVDMTVGGDNSAGDRIQFQFVPSAFLSSLGNGTLGYSPGFDQGDIAYISDDAPLRTDAHELGHLLGLTHFAQMDANGDFTPVNGHTAAEAEVNLMSQTGYVTGMGIQPINAQTLLNTQFQSIVSDQNFAHTPMRKYFGF